MRHRGPISSRRLSEAAIAALLGEGDVAGLIEANRAEFGGFRMMADDGDDGDDDDDDDGSEDDDDADADKGKGKKKKEPEGEDDDDDDEEDRRRLRKRMRAADKRAATLERELQAIKDKDKPELERAQTRVSELEETNKTLTETVNELRLQNAFLTANEQAWHDPDTALALAQSKGYLEDVVDEDGTVDKKALKRALERLAKDHGYLVKTKAKGRVDDEEDDDDEEDEEPPKRPSGTPSGRRSKNAKDGKARQQELKNRFPILGR